MRRSFAVVLLVAAVAIAVSIAFIRRTSPAGPSTAVRKRMRLAELPRQSAPAFTLVDQRGSQISLTSLRGRVVVLDFMDPRCVDTCPLVSEEFLHTARVLGSEHRRVVFLAVNVNEFHRRAADVAAFSRLHHLDRLAQWHFLTGPTRTLRAIWKAYGIIVEPNPNGDVVHSSLLYFIDRNGRERWAASPNTRQPLVGQWAKDIAQVAASLT